MKYEIKISLPSDAPCASLDDYVRRTKTMVLSNWPTAHMKNFDVGLDAKTNTFVVTIAFTLQ